MPDMHPLPVPSARNTTPLSRCVLQSTRNAEPSLRNYDIGFGAAVEMFGYRAFQPRTHLLRQRLADFNLLS